MACAGVDDSSLGDEQDSTALVPVSRKIDLTVVAKESTAMPLEVMQWQEAKGWWWQHEAWHIGRIWDRLDADGVAWAKSAGYTKAVLLQTPTLPSREGAAGNGVEFLAMHRAMIQLQVAQFPKYASLFASTWNPATATPPAGSKALTASMKAAIDRVTLSSSLAAFKSEDELGLFLETSFRPTTSNPNYQTTDSQAGLHNYLHGRFSIEDSAIDMGEPTKNLFNKTFWQLHGWIDGRWTAYRTLKGLKDTDTAYVKALADNKAMMVVVPQVAKSSNATAGSNDAPASVSAQLFR